jgi:hypothetical protein
MIGTSILNGLPDLGFLIANGLWFTGAAAALATLSYGRWSAHVRGLRLRDLILRDALLQTLILIALFCISAGRAPSDSAPLWERALWPVLTAAGAWQFFRGRRAR